jgi:hypothetical protein
MAKPPQLNWQRRPGSRVAENRLPLPSLSYLWRYAFWPFWFQLSFPATLAPDPVGKPFNA